MSLPLMVPWACKSRRHFYGVRAALTYVTQVELAGARRAVEPIEGRVSRRLYLQQRLEDARRRHLEHRAAEALGVGPSQSPQVLSVLAESPLTRTVSLRWRGRDTAVSRSLPSVW